MKFKLHFVNLNSFMSFRGLLPVEHAWNISWRRRLEQMPKSLQLTPGDVEEQCLYPELLTLLLREHLPTLQRKLNSNTCIWDIVPFCHDSVHHGHKCKLERTLWNGISVSQWGVWRPVGVSKHIAGSTWNYFRIKKRESEQYVNIFLGCTINRVEIGLLQFKL